MIEIKDKHNCCGCAACIQRCPKQCISLEEDNEGFLYPNVNKSLNPQLHSRSATYIKRNGLLIRKITIKSSRPFQCAYHPLTP